MNAHTIQKVEKIHRLTVVKSNWIRGFGVLKSVVSEFIGPEKCYVLGAEAIG
jgi:hypothetical protein